MPEASITSTPTAPTGTGTTIPNIALDTHQEDDILVIQAGWKGNQNATVLTGWTHWFTSPTGTASNGCTQGWWWRRVNAAETVSSPTLTIGTTAVERKAISYRIRGADIDNPGNMFWLKQQTVGNNATPTPPGITTLEPNYLIIHGVTCRGNSGVTSPTGYSEEEDLPEGTTLCVEGSTKVQATQTTLSGQAASISSNRWVAAIIAVPSKDYVKFRSQTSQTATGTSITGTLPTGTTNDDFYDQKDGMLALVKAAGNVVITAQDTGQWTEITEIARILGTNADSVKAFAAYAGVTNNLQFNRVGSGVIALQLLTFRNVHQTDFIGNAHSRNNSGTPAPWDAQARQNTKSTVYGIIVCDADTNNVNAAPSGFTERSDGVGIGTCDRVYEDGGTTPSSSWTTTNAANVAGLIELLSVAGVAGGGDVDVTPSTANFATTSFNSQLRLAITLNVTSLTVTTFAPKLDSRLIPDDSSLTLATFAPMVSIGTLVQPATVTLSLSTFTPSLQLLVTPNTAGLSITNLTPSLGLSVVPATASLTTAQFAPLLPQVVTPSTAALTTATLSPSLSLAVIPSVVTLTTASFAPSLSLTIAPITAGLTVTPFAPSTIQGFAVTPATATLMTSAFAPKSGVALTPSTSSLSLNSFATKLDTAVRPGVQSLVTQPFVADLKTALVPQVITLTLTTLNPSITAGLIASPAPADLITNRFTLSLTLTTIPQTRGLSIATFAPSISGIDIVPQTGTLTLAFYAPNVVAFNPRSVIQVSRENRVMRVSRETNAIHISKENNAL